MEFSHTRDHTEEPCPPPHPAPITIPDDVLTGLPTTGDVDFNAPLSTGPSLLHALRTVADRRDPRGVRHDFFALLALAVAATFTGARGHAAIWR